MTSCDILLYPKRVWFFANITNTKRNSASLRLSLNLLPYFHLEVHTYMFVLKLSSIEAFTLSTQT